MAASKKTNSDRRFTGGGPRPDNAKSKKEEGEEREKEWRKLSPKEQLKELDRRLGEGIGAVKQRARIIEGADKAKNKPTERAMGANPLPGDLERLEAQGFDTSRLKAKDRRAQERKDRPSK